MTSNLKLFQVKDKFCDARVESESTAGNYECDVWIIETRSSLNYGYSVVKFFKMKIGGHVLSVRMKRFGLLKLIGGKNIANSVHQM